MRRRVLSIVGALGLLTGLISSGVVAQADTSMSDSTFQSMVSFYQTLASFTGSFCYAPASTTSCPALTQGSATSTSNNVAVCVEVDHSAAPAQTCSITQTNATGNNIAIVIQIASRNSNDSTQNASQDAAIQQDNLSGSNFAAVVQFVKQSTGASGAQSQADNQFAKIEQNNPATLSAGTATGRNLAILAESSKQSASSQSGASQMQFSNQDVNSFPHHINQYSTGVSTAIAAQSQVLELFGTGPQTQTVDPRCCSFQHSNPGDTFKIVQFVSLTGNSTAVQNATSFGECHSSGTCTVSETTTDNGVTTNNTCPAPGGSPTGNCTAFISCTAGVCSPCTGSECFPPCLTNCVGLLLNNASFGNLALAKAREGATFALRAPIASRWTGPPSIRWASSAALLT